MGTSTTLILPFASSGDCGAVKTGVLGQASLGDNGDVAQVAIKFEHKTSKGCVAGGPPYEWSVYA